MKCEEDSTNNLFLRKEIKEDSDNSTANEWDDNKLIKAYDKAVSKAKQQIMKKCQAELEVDSDVQEVQIVSESSNPTKTIKKKANKDKSKWKVGSTCRAIYSEDGEEYEGRIVKMINGKWCVVKFLGYDNEEEVLLKELTPSLGKSVRAYQKEAAAIYNAELEDTDKESSSSTKGVSRKKKEQPFREQEPFQPKSFDQSFFPPRQSMFNSANMAPPPPPTNFTNFNTFGMPMAGGPNPITGLPTQMAGLAGPNIDSLNKMLLSWYMCGYHTGYCQRDWEDQHKSSGFWQ